MNSTYIAPKYKNNSEKISHIISHLQQIQSDSTIKILNISFCGSASPEGPYELNCRLANGRLKALEKLVRSKIEISDSIVSYDDSYIPWNYLITEVRESDISHKEEILSIIGEKSDIVNYHGGRKIDSRILKLQRLDEGKIWKEMLRRFFSPMRNACAVFVTFKSTPAVITPKKDMEEIEIPTDTVELVAAAPVVLDTVPKPVPVVDKWSHKLYVKTNAIGLGLAIANAAVETDLCKHWSFNLSLYYSAWNYFKYTVKFRTLAIQPEIRYWFSGENDGWFTGAHMGLAYYNIATDGEYRTQDHDGKSPALGGGLSIGYRMPISNDKRWKMEFSIGAGAYKLHHDKFRNYKNGLLVDTEKKTYIGLDQASVSLVYTFDLKRKGGAR